MTKIKPRRVKTTIRDDPEIDNLGDIYDVANYYRHHLPIEIRQGNTDEVRMTFFKKGERAAHILVEYENGRGSIQYDISLIRGRK